MHFSGYNNVGDGVWISIGEGVVTFDGVDIVSQSFQQIQSHIDVLQDLFPDVGLGHQQYLFWPIK